MIKSLTYSSQLLRIWRFVGVRGLLTSALVACFSSMLVEPGSAQTPTKMVPTSMRLLPALQRSQLVGAATSSQILHVSVNLQLAQSAALKAFADSVSDPTSPNYRHFLTPAQVGEQFGQPMSTVQSVVNYLTSNGFKITRIPANHFNILADCTVAQAAKAFGTNFNRYHATSISEPGNINYVAFSQTPQVPATLSSVINGISGLETYTKPFFRELALTPAQTHVLYNTAPIVAAGFHGEKRHVAISSWDGFKLSNVPLYYTQFNLPAPPAGVLSNVTVDTIDGGSQNGPLQGEGDLDIQMILGMAPLSTFTIYDGGLNRIDVVTAEADDNTADIISESYGWQLEPADAIANHNVQLAMTAQGITYMAATGDTGTTLLGPYPDTDGEVLGVGGTIATYDNTGKRQAEVAWSKNGAFGPDAAGGGGWTPDTSPFNTLPKYQKGNGVPTNINFRLMPDIAFQAAGFDNGAYQVFINGVLNFDIGGTSCSSPGFAGMLTIAEQQAISLGAIQSSNGVQRLGRIQDVIYGMNGRSDIFFDVTSGFTGVLPNGQQANAGPGWDFCTGWGPMDVDAFITAATVLTKNVSEAPSTAVVYGGDGSNAFGVQNLARTDGSYFTEQSVRINQLGSVADTLFTFNVAQNASTLVKMSVALNTTGSKSLTNFTYLLNVKTGNYDEIGGGPLTGGPTAFNYTIATPSNYVANGKVTMVIRQIWPIHAGSAPFTSQIDSLLLNYAYAVPNP